MKLNKLSLPLAFLSGAVLTIPATAPWPIIKLLGSVASILLGVEAYLTHKRR